MINKDYYYLPTKLIHLCGLELGFFIVLLLDKEKYHREKAELTQDGYFYATDTDIMLISGFTSSQILKLKKEAVEKELVFIKKQGIPRKTYYKPNLLKIKEIMT